MFFTTVIFVAIALFYQTAAECDTEKKVVNLELYYESLCKDSINFITTQLAPNYKIFKDHLNITFVPYGKSTYKKGNDDRYEFTCHHGPDECIGNKIQSCAINIINQNNASSEADRQLQTVNFVGCVMAKNPKLAYKQCAQDAKLSESMINEITSCSESVMGEKLLVENGEKTASVEPAITFVPTLIAYRDANEMVKVESKILQEFHEMLCGFLRDECHLFSECKPQ